MRFWSDFNRVYYVPRSLHSVPRQGFESDQTWTNGRNAFMRLDTVRYVALVSALELNSVGDKEAQVLEGSVRSFVEECNLMQVCSFTRSLNSRI